MNDKVLVNLYVPMLEKKYDVFLPVSKRIGEATILIGKAVKDISGDIFELKGTERLYSKITGKEYNEKLFVKSTDIRNGSKLIFL